jgi:hypothetical protein
MKARLLLSERQQIGSNAFVALRVWEVPEPVRGSAHGYKYSLALIVDGGCVLRYDNEAGKGEHKHVGPQQAPYRFVTAEQLVVDFWQDVDR